MNMVNTKHNSTEDMINKLQQLKGKTKLIIYKIISNCYDNMNIRFDEDPSAKSVRGMFKIYHEVFLLKEFLQTKPQIKKMNIKYYELYYTVIRNRDEKKIEDNKYENDFISLSDVSIPNHYIGIKPR